LTFHAAAASLILAFFAALWARQRVTRNVNSADAWWALGIGAFAAALAWREDGDPLRRLVLGGLVGAWSLRLAAHLYFDRVRGGRPEDGRYARFRKTWSQGAFLGFYLAQGALVFLLPLALLPALRNPLPFPTAADAASLAIWLLALGGEGLADRQLARFRADPANKGKTCRRGLWRYSRHPNYFFEWLLWCAYVPLAAGSPLFWVSLLGPALLLFLLLKVSGIPPTEAQALASRGDDYRDYQRTTSAFFPWLPAGK
jgi:steroid 5-alpha reductase family enzyme